MILQKQYHKFKLTDWITSYWKSNTPTK